MVSAIELPRASYRKMLENLVWATGYNVVAIPIAAGVLAPWGNHSADERRRAGHEPVHDLVALNAQLLRRLKLRRR